MPKYWITMHWAHPEPDDLPFHVYRKHDGREPDLEVGHRVLFYEGRRPVDANGTVKFAFRVHHGQRARRPLGEGAAAIVAEGVVTQPWREINSDDVVYDYGDLERWKWVAPCEAMRSKPLPLKEIWSALGKQYPPQSFGLKPISASEYNQLISRMRD